MKQECLSKMFDEHLLHFLTETQGINGFSRVGCAKMVMHQASFHKNEVARRIQSLASVYDNVEELLRTLPASNSATTHPELQI